MDVPLVVCSVFKNEAKYIQEWIEFHRIVGVSKFFLYNNNSADNFLEILSPYIKANIVDLTDWPMSNPSQLAAYSHFINKAGKVKVWAAFIDIDEFLFSPILEKVTTVLNLCDSPQAFGVNWLCFGSGGQIEYRPQPVIKRFTLRGPDSLSENLHIKSIIRLDQDVSVGSNPHYFQVQYGTYTEASFPLFGPFTPTNQTQVLRINHYKTKSKQEWLARSLTGKPDRAHYNIDWDHFNAINGQEVQDFTIQKHLPELEKRLISPLK